MTPPICVFAYNRPRHLQVCLEAITRSMEFSGKEFPLFIFCDAPKNGSAKALVEATRAVALQHQNATVILRSQNFGFRNITEGISQICAEFKRAIIIEDDVWISPDFLGFMEASLDRYENESKVWMISGFMYANSQPQIPETFFIPSAFIWGWATWERAWKYYDWTPKGVEVFFSRPQNKMLFDFHGTYPFSKMLFKTLEGKCNTWDVQWMFTIAKNEGLCLYPHTSLIWNSGIGGGVHGNIDPLNPYLHPRLEYVHGKLTPDDFKKPRLSKIVFPKKIELSKDAIAHLAALFLKQEWNQKKGIFKKLALRLAFRMKIASFLKSS